MTAADALTAEKLRAGAAALRLQGQAARAAELDDLADDMQRRGSAPAIKKAAATARKKGDPTKAAALDKLADQGGGPSLGTFAAYGLAGGAALALLSRGRRR